MVARQGRYSREEFARIWYTVSRITINVDEIQRDMPGYLLRVSAGETLLILQGGKPIAEIKPVAPVLEKLRPFGLCAGEFTVPSDFDAALPDEILAEFEEARRIRYSPLSDSTLPASRSI